MPDCEAKKRWDKENVTYVMTKLFANTDQDIIAFLADKPKATTFKIALREYIKNHPEE